MSIISQEDRSALDAFMLGSSDFIGHNLIVESKGKVITLLERSTSTVIAQLNLTTIPTIKLRKSFVGYEYLPGFFEENDFIPSRSTQEGIMEFKFYELDGYSIQQTNINTLWKEFRKLINKNKKVKILNENEWCDVTNIIHEDFTYVVRMPKGKDLIIAMQDFVIMWAKPDEQLIANLDSWNTGILPDQKIPAALPSFGRPLNTYTYSDHKREDLQQGLNALSTDVKGLQEYVVKLFQFIVKDKEERLSAAEQLTQRVIALEETVVLQIQESPDLQFDSFSSIDIDEEQGQTWAKCDLEDKRFNLTDDSTRFSESSGSTSLMMPLN